MNSSKTWLRKATDSIPSHVFWLVAPSAAEWWTGVLRLERSSISLGIYSCYRPATLSQWFLLPSITWCRRREKNEHDILGPFFSLLLMRVVVVFKRDTGHALISRHCDVLDFCQKNEIRVIVKSFYSFLFVRPRKNLVCGILVVATVSQIASHSTTIKLHENVSFVLRSGSNMCAIPKPEDT